MSSMVDPLVSPPPSEIPLKDAPLVRVIAQVRFPRELAVETAERVAPFQTALRAAYPVLRKEHTQTFKFSAAGAEAVQPQTAWRFNDTDGDWRVSLTTDFLALETTKYTSRADFCARLKVALEALDEHFGPKQVDRLGVRYIDRIADAAVEDISKLVVPEVCGIVGTEAFAHAVQAISDTRFELPDARVTARWGQLPEGATHDPLALETIDERSWILDLDMSTRTSTPFSVDGLVTTARTFAERIYTIFRWAVTDEFLRRYGGEL